ncbi:MAG TPA: flotillin domain-containing protein [Burkholderiaceae bacterium]|nr:flotillin domain-containing protein [Burkholderiaceae bacterium]
MNGADIIAIIILAAIVIAIAVYLLHWLYKHSSKDLSFVRTGLGGERVVMGGGALVLPIVHDITEVNMNTLRIEVRRSEARSLITRNRMRIEVAVEFFVRVIATPEAVAAAARTLGSRTLNPEGLRDLVQGRFVDAMGAVAARMTMEEIHEKRSEYIRGVRELVATTLTENGLELETASLTSLDQADMKFFNPSNAFDAEGLTRLTEEIETRKKKRNDIEQDTAIAIKKKNLESEKLALTIDQESEHSRLAQEREIAVRRAQQKAEVALERTDREREIQESQIRATESVERARIVQQNAVESERIQSELGIQRMEVLRRRAVDIEEQDRVIALAVKSGEQASAQAAAEEMRALMIKAQEHVATVRDLEIAERRKSVELIDAAQQAERDAIRTTTAAKAELKAADDRAQAEIKAAEAAKVRYEIDAQGRRALNESENMRSDASRRSALQRELITNLPAIIRESVKPMESIDSIKILQVDGLPGLSGASAPAGDATSADAAAPGGRGANLAENVVNSALRYRAQVPFVDALLGEIGMSPNAMSSIGGLAVLPLTDDGTAGRDSAR